MIVVSDTSSISNLIQIGEIELLRATFSTVVVPDAVYAEICRIESNRIALTSLEWIERKSVSNTTLKDRFLLRLDAGEAEAIVLAMELSADYLLIDESLGREIAKELGLTITGILGVLLRAKSEGHISEIKPFIDRLVNEAGFRLNKNLIANTLYQAGEA